MPSDSVPSDFADTHVNVRANANANANINANALLRSPVQEFHLTRARSSLKLAVNRYSQELRSRRRKGASIELQAALKTELDRLSASLDKLNTGLLRIAVFGLVSRGKSAVVNALLGQKLLPTGPLHGVTQYPRSVYWSIAGGEMQVELIDTPGLDEVGGDLRESMAREVADQADLILFVVAGDITRTEYEALAHLQSAYKPLILVFNKTDLYPKQDRQAIARKLQHLFASVRDRRGEERQPVSGSEPLSDLSGLSGFSDLSGLSGFSESGFSESGLSESGFSESGLSERPFLTAEDIVFVAAEPAPIQVQVEHADGRVTYEWEQLLPQVEELQQKLLEILNREGKSLLALNALRQAQSVEAAIARKTTTLLQSEAETLIWRFTQWKSLAIAVNPVAVLDLFGGAVADLVMIRSLARLYGLPMTNHEAEKLLRSILWSSGALLVGEIGSGLLFGVGKSAAAIATAFDSGAGLAAYTTAAIAQASLAGYGSYRVGKAAQAYLENGCSWGPQGASTVLQEILQQVDRSTIIHRLRRSLEF